MALRRRIRGVSPGLLPAGLALLLLAGGGTARAQDPPTPAPSPAPEGDTGDATNVIDLVGSGTSIEDIDFDRLLNVEADEGGVRTTDDAPNVLTVVSDEDIKRLGATTVAEVLETIPGFEVLVDSLGHRRVIVRGLPGAITTGGSENVQFLLNGRRLNEALTGGATEVNLDLAVENVKRLEIVRGPGGVASGPGSFYAVVNLVTETVDTFRRDELTLGAGSFGTYLYSFRYGTNLKGVSIAGFLQYVKTAGPELSIPRDAQSLTDANLLANNIVRELGRVGINGYTGASLAPGTTAEDRKGQDSSLSIAYGNFTLSGRIRSDQSGAYVGILDRLVPTDNNRLTARQIAADAEYHADAFRFRVEYLQSAAQNSLQVFPASFVVPNSPAASGAPFLYRDGGFFQQSLSSRRLGAKVLFDQSYGAHAVSAGASVEREATYDLTVQTNFDLLSRNPAPCANPRQVGCLIDAQGLVPDARRRIASAYVQDTWNPAAAVSVMAGLRVEDYEDFGTKAMPRLGLAVRPRKDLNVKLTYGRGLRVPSFGELYFSTPAILANTSLRPSTIDSVEAGLLYRAGDLRLGATAFGAWIDDAIGLAGTGTLFRPDQVANVPGYRTVGVELEASRHFGDLGLVQFNYTFQDPKTRDTDIAVAGMARHLGHAAIQVPVGSYLIVAPSVTWRGGRVRAASDTRADVDGYALVDLVVRTRTLLDRFELSAQLQNAFDVVYVDPSPAVYGVPGDYPRAGRAFLVRARYRF